MRVLASITVILFATSLVLFLFKPSPTLGNLWLNLNSGSLNFIQTYISDAIWYSLIRPLLIQPPWFGFLILASCFAVPYALLWLVRRQNCVIGSKQLTGRRQVRSLCGYQPIGYSYCFLQPWHCSLLNLRLRQASSGLIAMRRVYIFYRR